MILSELFTAVAGALPARRGSLQEQYPERERADGTARRNGPYYVWTALPGLAGDFSLDPVHIHSLAGR